MVVNRGRQLPKVPGGVERGSDGEIEREREIGRWPSGGFSFHIPLVPT